VLPRGNGAAALDRAAHAEDDRARGCEDAVALSTAFGVGGSGQCLAAAVMRRVPLLGSVDLHTFGTYRPRCRVESLDCTFWA